MGTREFGDFMARLRSEAGISPEELARRLGRKSKSVVYDLERGEQDPTVADLNILAAELNTSVESLLLALGARLVPSAASLLPTQLIVDATALTPDGLRLLSGVAKSLAETHRRADSPPPGAPPSRGPRT